MGNEALRKPISKSELANLYGVSRRTLSRWIKQNQALYDNLIFTGYKASQKLFTIEQVKLIFFYLGEPMLIKVDAS